MSVYDRMAFDMTPVSRLPISLHNLESLLETTGEKSRREDLNSRINYVKSLMRKAGYEI
jgi:hypothetical protein